MCPTEESPVEYPHEVLSAPSNLQTRMASQMLNKGGGKKNRFIADKLSFSTEKLSLSLDKLSFSRETLLFEWKT